MVTLVTKWGTYEGYKVEHTNTGKVILTCLENCGEFRGVRLYPFFSHEVLAVFTVETEVTVTRID